MARTKFAWDLNGQYQVCTGLKWTGPSLHQTKIAGTEFVQDWVYMERDSQDCRTKFAGLKWPPKSYVTNGVRPIIDYCETSWGQMVFGTNLGTSVATPLKSFDMYSIWTSVCQCQELGKSDQVELIVIIILFEYYKLGIWHSDIHGRLFS